MKKAGLILGVLCLVATVIIGIAVYGGITPTPKPPKGVRLQPARPPLKVAEVTEENAAFYYLKAIQKLTPAPPRGFRDTAAAFLKGDDKADRAMLEKLVAQHAEALDLVRQGAMLQKCQMPWNDLMSSGSGGEILAIRDLGILLCVRAKLDEQAGRNAEAARGFLDVIRFGLDGANDGAILPMLVGVSVVAHGNSALRAITLNSKLSAEELQAIQSALLSLQERFPADAETLRNDAIDMKRMITSGWAGSRIGFSKKDALATLDAAYGELIADAEKPYWERQSEKIILRWTQLNKSRIKLINRPFSKVTVGLALPAVGGSGSRSHRARCDLIGTRITCALQAFKMEHGTPPDRLEQLTPKFLPTVPADPFDGKPFRYRQEGDGWVIWSVGSDLVDDEAKRHEFKYHQVGDPTTGGDIYFKPTEPQDDLEEMRKESPIR